MAFQKGHKKHSRKKYAGDKPYSRYQSIHLLCSECSGNSKLILNCQGTDCTIFVYRTGKKNTKGYTGKKIFTKALAMKEFCTWCCGGSPSVRKNCPDNSCPFYPYRNGKNEPEGYIRKSIGERITF